MPLFPANCTIAIRYCTACLKGCCIAYSPSRTPPLNLTSFQFCDSCTGCPCDNESISWSLSWSSASIWKCTNISGRRVSAHLYVNMRQLCSTETAICVFVVLDVRTTPLAIGVLQLLDHACGIALQVTSCHCDTLGEFKQLLKTHLFGDHGTL